VEDFRQVRRDQQHAGAALAQVADEAVDGDARADVDAHGRLVEDEQLHRRDQPLGEQDLLLIAAGQPLEIVLDVARLQIEAVGDIANLAALAAAVEEAETGERSRSKPRQRDVLANAAHHHQPFLAPVGRQIEGAEVEHPARRASGDVAAIKHNAAGGEPLQAEAGAPDHRLAAADQSGEPDDFAGADGERKAADQMVGGGEP
jgi:hypothetical protein